LGSSRMTVRHYLSDVKPNLAVTSDSPKRQAVRRRSAPALPQDVANADDSTVAAGHCARRAQQPDQRVFLEVMMGVVVGEVEHRSGAALVEMVSSQRLGQELGPKGRVAPSLPMSTKTWFTPYYFSIVTYTTLGFGDVKPRTLVGELVVSSELILGYTTLGLLLSVLAQNIARRS
jgi:hypothetical protein